MGFGAAHFFARYSISGDSYYWTFKMFPSIKSFECVPLSRQLRLSQSRLLHRSVSNGSLDV